MPHIITLRPPNRSEGTSLSFCLVVLLTLSLLPVSAQSKKPPSLATRWATQVTASNSLSTYPRPTLVRDEWLGLNGSWDFGIASLAQTNLEAVFSSRIHVPFPVESALSGIKRPMVTERQRMWYRRQFTVPHNWQGQRKLLHFEAVDWETTVWVNGKEIGRHQGGFDRFSFDITDALKPTAEQELIVSVFDPTDSGAQPRGKQMQHPKQPFFTSCSGIWQTVWLEPVPATSLESVKLVPDIDSDSLGLTVVVRGNTNGFLVRAVGYDGGKEIGRVAGGIGESLRLSVPKPRLWSPDNPFLYDLKIELLKDGNIIDSASSYFGMRKISIGKAEDGFLRLMLNNRPLFHLGPLDQGYWPDGVYTAPTDDALRYDIDVMKQLGFNMSRKHVKIEPERWYYWCDKLGLLVWQDMPNGNRPASAREKEITTQPGFANQFETDLKEMIAERGNHPSIVIWVLFNQGWGQYDTARITALCKELDSSRLVISASGWHDMKTGDVASYHQYPFPMQIKPDNKRATVVGECGALAMVLRDHLWGGIGNWNMTYYQTADALTSAYTDMISKLVVLKEKSGVSAAVITQLTDVEAELDGFMTYDRAIIKMPVDVVRQLNEKIVNQETTSATNAAPIK